MMKNGVKVQMLDGERVLYQYIDPNNLALVTKDTLNNRLILYILNSLSGNLIYNSYVTHVDLHKPINIIVD